MSEPPVSPIAVVELLDDLEAHLLDGHEHHLGDALSRLYLVAPGSPVPAGNEYLSLVVGVDQPGQVAEHEAVLVAEARTRQEHRGKTGIPDVDGEPGRDQLRCTGLDATGSSMHALMSSPADPSVA